MLCFRVKRASAHLFSHFQISEGTHPSSTQLWQLREVSHDSELKFSHSRLLTGAGKDWDADECKEHLFDFNFVQEQENKKFEYDIKNPFSLCMYYIFLRGSFRDDRLTIVKYWCYLRIWTEFLQTTIPSIFCLVTPFFRVKRESSSFLIVRKERGGRFCPVQGTWFIRARSSDGSGTRYPYMQHECFVWYLAVETVDIQLGAVLSFIYSFAVYRMSAALWFFSSYRDSYEIEKDPLCGDGRLGDGRRTTAVVSFGLEKN